MKEVSAFLKNELDSVIDTIHVIQDKIHTLSLDIEFIEKACSKITDSRDHTQIVFLSGGSENAFEENELKKLQAQKAEFIQLKNDLEQNLKEKEERYEYLRHLSEDCLKNAIHTSTYEELSLQEADRQRIAMDIHDTVIQNLTALILKNEFVLRIMDSDIQRAKLELKNNNDLLKSSINELRDIIYNLRPMSLDDLGFEHAFNNLMNKISANTDMVVTYDYNADEIDTDSVVLINLLRMIQELCNNSIKHSKGSQIYVKIDQDQEQILVTVEDDGIGFEYNEKEQNGKGFGLSMVKDRIVLFNGTLQIEKIKDGGMRYRIGIPLKRRK